MIFKMAVRNLGRNKRTNMVIGIIMAVGLIFVVIALSFIEGIKTNYEQLILSSMAGDLSISAEDDTFAFTKDMENLTTNEQIRSVAPRLYASCYLFNADDDETYETVTAIGIDVDQDEALVDNFSRKEEEFVLGKDKIAITKQKAKALDLKVGDKAQLVFLTSKGQSEKKEVTISCLYEGKSSNAAIEAWAILPISTMRSMLELEKDQVSTVKVFLEDGNDLEEYRNLIEKKLDDKKYTVESWKETSAADMMRTPTIYSGILLAFAGVLFVLIAIGITSVLFSALLGKTKEFGVMQTLGMKRGQIVLMNLFEMVILITVSMVSGVIICQLATIGINAAEIEVASDALKFTFGGNVLSVKMTLVNCLIPAVFIFSLSCLISVIAVRKVTRIPILEAMNEQ